MLPSLFWSWVYPTQILNIMLTNLFFLLSKIKKLHSVKPSLGDGSPLTGSSGRKHCLVSCPQWSHIFDPFIHPEER